MKRRMALLAVLAGANFLLPVTASGKDSGKCQSCADWEWMGKTVRVCAIGLDHGYDSCVGGHPTNIPCVNSVYSCGKDPE